MIEKNSKSYYGHKLLGEIYEKEGNNYFLRIVIDRIKPIDIDTCVEVTHLINPLLDNSDIISDSYILDISSKEKGDNNE